MPLGLTENAYKYVLPLTILDVVLFKYAFTADLRTWQLTLGLLGEFWCVAAMWVEVNVAKYYPDFDHENAPDMALYKPFCDFASWGCCSKVLMSPPGRLLRILYIAKKPGGDSWLDFFRGQLDYPNPCLGILYFALHLFYPLFTYPFFEHFPLVGPYIPTLAFAITCAIALMPFYLGYQLFFVLKDFCIVCVSQYVAIFGLVPMMYGLMKAAPEQVSWFGSMPIWFAAVFGALDLAIGIGALLVWLKSPAHARESAHVESATPYLRIV